eukprot:CAMPEP_0172707834 /NCGR_PEP_ID=MMETSP1074-20121228/50205_1 /TAXON_ID=2916 /ORGANISM="Ceratium fusus, Strain PA161109" /LENGTH=262 /DNA_ID=CAMNT_0013530703 /DNA_START=58 /DNA_END=846 /DNA_ORIENTATION=+
MALLAWGMLLFVVRASGELCSDDPSDMSCLQENKMLLSKMQKLGGARIDVEDEKTSMEDLMADETNVEEYMAKDSASPWTMCFGNLDCKILLGGRELFKPPRENYRDNCIQKNCEIKGKESGKELQWDVNQWKPCDKFFIGRFQGKCVPKPTPAPTLAPTPEPTPEPTTSPTPSPTPVPTPPPAPFWTKPRITNADCEKEIPKKNAKNYLSDSQMRRRGKDYNYRDFCIQAQCVAKGKNWNQEKWGCGDDENGNAECDGYCE